MQTENPDGNQKGAELEKFKRRMIRSVARKLMEKMPEEDMWKEMKKELGSHGQKLWERMRMLTLKKLKRLLEADDRVQYIGRVARMTLTDWLLFDLVIVHEKIDVINRDKLNGTYDSKVLSNLFSLVQRFEIEGRTGEDLAEAWTAATVYYNSKGHQCSPMMLQRRWYQIKELTRHKFYKFWYNYRGNQRALVTAKQDSPDDLQKAIALKYPKIVTEHFPNWEERIESRLVILPDELGVKMQQRNLMKASDTSAPDVVLVEPHIETIDLGAYSDEDDLETEQITNPTPTVRIKSEPVDIDIDDDMHQYENPPKKKSVFDEEIERLQMAEENFDNSSLENNDTGKSIVIEPKPVDGESDDEVDQNDTDLADNSNEIIIDRNETDCANDAIVIDDDENNDEANTQVQILNAREQEKGILDEMGSTIYSSDDVVKSQAGDESNTALLEISSAARVGIKVVDVKTLLKGDKNLNAPVEQQSTDNTSEPIISRILCEEVMVEKDLADSEFALENTVLVQNKTIDGTRTKGQNETTEVLPVISNISSYGIKVEMESDTSAVRQSGESSENYEMCEVDDNSLGEPTQTNMDDLKNVPKIAKISSVASAGINVENFEDVPEKAKSNNGKIEHLSDGNNSELLPVISTILSERFDLQNDSAVSKYTLENDVSAANETAGVLRNEDQNEVTELLPIISTVSSNGIKMEMEYDKSVDKLTGLSATEESSQKDGLLRKVHDESLEEPLPAYVEDLNCDNVHLNILDEDIAFADDGIAYVEEYEDDIIKITDHIPLPIKNESDEESPEDTNNESEEQTSMADLAEEGTQKFDLKLLMYPVVYTTKLDDMTDIDGTEQYEHVKGVEKIDKIYTLSKPISDKYITGCKTDIDTEPEVDTSQDKMEKGEDIDNASNVSDDDLFKDENRGSFDSDCELDRDFIDDGKKVKMSSYLLRKPKHRTYNPVLLCKNPDFNTRLKKLSVGFFMSTRNRMLLQSCIPMTIDLSKTFENKLINGTLYLKDVPQVSTVKTEPVIEINDDIQITSADLIQPTAVQQSMMSIDEPFLENELKKRMAERVRGINLPDISQIRRLNQHLLTAEVTPLRLDNQTSQNPQSEALTPDQNSDQTIENSKNNLLAYKNDKETPNTLSIDVPPISISTDMEPTPPPLLVKNPQLWMQLSSPTSLSSRQQPLLNKNPVLGERSTPAPMVSIADSLLREIISNPTDPVRVTPSVSNISSGNSHTVTNANIAPDSVTVRRKMRKTHYPIPTWNQPKANQPKQEQYHSDALLTLDTLYKMLSALDPRDTALQGMLPKKKVKRKNRVEKAVEQVSDHNSGNDTNQDLPSRKHRCMPDMCTCCCKLLYPEQVIEVMPLDTDQAKDLSDKQIQTEPLLYPEVEKETHGIKQLQQENKAENERMSPTNDYGEHVSNEDGLQEAENSSDNVKTSDEVRGINILSSRDEIAKLKQSRRIKTTPIPKVRVHSGKTVPKNVVHKLDLPFTSQSISHDMAGLITNLENTIIPVTENNVAKHEFSQRKIKWNVSHTSVAPTRKVGRPRKYPAGMPPCLCRPNISNVKEGKIEINIGNDCALHTVKKQVVNNKISVSRVKEKKLKENKIILNKKIVTDDTRPFFVGKGKILLTNIKLPSRKPPPAPLPQFINVRLPEGVQIVLLPDQTLTYVVASDVILTPEEYALIPQFLVAIQQQMANTTGNTLHSTQSNPIEIIDLDKNDIPPPEIQEKSNEIIDLDKDDIPPPKIQEKPNIVIDLDKNDSLPLSEISMQTAEENTKCIENTVAKNMNVPFSTELNLDTTSNESNEVQGFEDFEMKIDTLEVDRNKQESVSTSVEEENASTVSGVDKPENIESNTVSEKASETNEINESLSSNKDFASANKNNESNAPESTNENANKKSLLSDLMEMSGIMEEDLIPLPVQVETPQEPIILDTSNLVLQQEVPLAPVLEVFDSPPKEFFKAQSTQGAVELMAITSFFQLKYATDNNGKFFKLDLDNGQLTSINVCIQRFNHQESKLKSKSVIDLTDDPDVSITKDTEPKVPIYLIDRQTQKSKKPSILTHIRPEKRNSTLMTSVLEKKKRLMNRYSNNLKPANIPQSKIHVSSILKRTSNLLRLPPLTYYKKRKNMDNVTAKINLVDSDTPMEEEYLSSDSSDDEPLIHKVKRMRLEEMQGNQDANTINEPEPQQINNSSSPDKTIEETEMLQDVEELSNGQQNSQEELAQDDQEFNSKEAQVERDDDIAGALTADEDDYVEEYLEETEDARSATSSPVPVPTNLFLSGGASNTPLNYLPNEADAEEDDCILGV